MKKIFSIIILSLIFTMALGLNISHTEPPNWWEGMEHDTLKILIYGDDFSGWNADIKSRNIKLISQGRYDDPHYYFLEFKVKKAGDANIVFKHPEQDAVVNLSYPIYEREPYTIMTIDGSDVVYLLMPDRFADGDKSNNLVPGHQDPVRPEHKWGRRGGDLQGVIDHLDYLSELGISALWMTPVYENNYVNCYHGYTPTNSYGIEPHLGDFSTYHELVDACHKRGIKIIQDHIVNHVSPTHPLAVNPPSEQWLNGSLDDHESCNYRIRDITDIYGPKLQREFPVKGWFAGYLADMNMANPEVVNYYVNHAIWWIETMKLDGIREDTYAYSDLEGLSRWAKELKKEYPDLFIVGEVMEFDRTRLSYYFNESNKNYLSSVADFGFSSELYQLIVENKPVADFYAELANDFIYRDPGMMLTFLDNHDMGRLYSAINGDEQAYLNALTMLLVMRGIPQLYYGNEIGMPGGHDPENRNEFPGGFDYSDHNAFDASGRHDKENLFVDLVKKLTSLRHEYPGIFRSVMTHDLDDEIYLVARKDPKDGTTLLMAYNSDNKTGEASFESLLQHKINEYHVIKYPHKGRLTVNPDDQTMIIPPGETVLLIIK